MALTKFLPYAGASHSDLEVILRILKHHKKRITKPRLTLLRELLSATGPLTIEELRARAADTRRSVDYSTTYRFLLQLEEVRLARRVHIGLGTSYFAIALPNQSRKYLVCIVCGMITALEISVPVLETERLIADRHGFTALSHSLDFHGICSTCTTAETAEPYRNGAAAKVMAAHKA